jgi:hypothetical protein
MASTGSGPGDGEWAGFLRYDGSATFTSEDGDLNADYLGAGGFSVIVTGGTADGEYGFNVDTELPDLGTTAQGIGNGTVGGAVDAMTLTLASVAVRESSIGLNLIFSAGELGNPSGVLVATRTSCDLMSGTWNHEFTTGVEASGGSTDGIGGTWTALRVGDGGAADEAREQMAEFQSVADDVLTSFGEGGLDIGQLRDFLALAESVAATIPRGDCDRSAGDFRHLGLFVVDTMLSEAAGYIEDLTLSELLELIRSGTRTGAFDSDDDLRSAYESHLVFLASEAAADGDARTLERLLAAARLAGWTASADVIAAQLEDAR